MSRRFIQSMKHGEMAKKYFLFISSFSDQNMHNYTGQNLCRVFNSRSVRVHDMHLHCIRTKMPNLKLKTRHKQSLVNLTWRPAVLTPPFCTGSLATLSTSSNVLHSIKSNFCCMEALSRSKMAKTEF
jgi:hypothetical protein